MKQSCFKPLVTTPIWVYCIGLVISMALILIECIIGNCGSLCINIGVGIFSSLIVAFLIDISNTKRNYKRDQANRNELTRHYISTFLDLRDQAMKTAEERIGSDGKARTFNEWIVLALNGGCTDEERDYFDIKYAMRKINQSAEHLYSVLLHHLYNEQISGKYREHVKRICSMTSYISFLLEKGDNTQSVCTITKRLIPLFLSNNQECTHYFRDVYNTDRYSEEE